jgi:hypothetical protein
MKRIFIVLTLSCLVTACSQAPDLTKPAPIRSKTMYPDKAWYQIEQSNEGSRGAGSGEIGFYGPLDSAQPGDVLVVVDGAWTKSGTMATMSKKGKD